jgi:uncharacterized cupredoxin-like copper-binding protein
VRPVHRNVRRLFAIGLAAFAVAACGGDDESVEAGFPTEAPRETFEVRLSEFRIEPETITIAEPGVYRFRAVNVGSIVHALRIRGGEIDVETPSIGAKQRNELTVELERGTYELICPVGDHEDRGMTGSVDVGGAAGGMGEDGDGGEDDDYGGYGGG